uniref:Uncharacterized protein n=3 Tax=Vibrionaceae TaxID=641 RepID=A0A0H3ZT06_9VIBR|nr:hypothetical protein [Vibrio sp. FF_304]AKN36859.1 hypothetical protein [Enterovibrio norvegicus]AKN39405.1 hypothetical protein [Vibrio tasmaniensis]
MSLNRLSQDSITEISASLSAAKSAQVDPENGGTTQPTV